MSTDVVLPPLGESVTEATVSRWLKAVGDEVTADEPLLEVSTDKVDTEIPAPASGVLQEIRYNEDDIAHIGDVLAVIGSPATPAPWAPAPTTPVVAPAPQPVTPQPSAPVTPATPQVTAQPMPPAMPQPSAPAVTPPAPQPAAQPTVPPVTAAPVTPPTPIWRTLFPSDRVPAAPAPLPATPPAEVAAPVSDTPAPAPAAAPVAPAADEPGYVTPLVRKLASQLGLDLAAVHGTGVGGRVRKQDLLDAAGRRDAGQDSPANVPLTSDDDPRRGTTQPLSAERVAQAEMVAQTARAALSAALEADLTLLDGQTSGSPLGHILAAVAATLRTMADLNASLADDAVVYHATENIGLAVDTPDGPLTPVLHDAGQMTPAQLAAAAADLTARAAAGQLTPADLADGTFTVRDDGASGVAWAIPAINRPQVAALSIGRSAPRPVIITDDAGPQVASRDFVWLTLSYDRRVVDPGRAAAFLSRLRDALAAG